MINNKKIKIKDLINNFLFLLASIMYPIFIVIIPSYNSGVGNITTNILLIILFLLFIFNLKEIFRNSKNNIIIFVIEILLLIISYQTTNTGIGSMEAVIVLSLILLSSSVIKINRKCIYFCIPYYLIIWIYSIYINYNVLAVNSNNAACISFYMSIILISTLSLFLKTNKKNLIIYGLIIFIGISKSIFYDSRNITIVYILMFFIILLFYKKKIVNFSKLKIISIWFLISLFSLIIVFTYIYFSKNNIKLDFSFLSEKNFYTGRENIWDNLLTVFNNENYIFGIGSNSIWFPSMGAHNYMLSVLVLFGLPHFIAFVILLYTYIKKIFVNESNIIVCYSIIALFLTEYFEASLIDGRKLAVLFILTCIYFSTDKNKLEEREHYEETQIITNNIKS